MEIQAAVLRAPDLPLRIESVELSTPGIGEVLVRIEGVGLCHTDLMPRRGLPSTLPIVLGHEGAGVVEAVGPGVTRVRPGQHVVLTFDSCGWCDRCTAGESPYCELFRERNLSGRRPDGSTCLTDSAGSPVSGRWFGQSSFATHALATERNTVPVAPSLPLDVMAPLGCSVQCGAAAVLLEPRVGPGSKVAVFGTGAVGLAAVMAARVAGASRIVAVDLDPGRRELALELGATHAVDGATPDLAAEATEIAGGADFCLDTTAVPSVVRTALACLRPRGMCALVGTGGGDLVLPLRLLQRGQFLSYLVAGNGVPQRLIPMLVDLWRSGRFPLERLVRRYPLTAIAEAERDLLDRLVVKPVLVPGT